MRLLGTFVIVFSLLVSCQNLPTHHPFPEEETLQQLLKKQTDTVDYTLDGELTEKAVKRLDEEVKLALQQRDTAFFVRLINQWRAENFFKARISLPFEQRKQIFYEYSAKDSTHLMYYFYTMGSYYAIGHQVDSMKHYYQHAADLAFKLHTDNNAIIRNYADGLNALGLAQQSLAVMHDYDRIYQPRHLFDHITRAATYVCLWLNQGQRDSAAYYQQQLEEFCNRMPDSEFNNGYHTSITFIEKLLRTHCDKLQGKPLNMIDIYLFAEQTAKVNREQKRIEQERITIQNLLEKKNLYLQIEKERSQQFVFILLFSILCLILFLAYLYQRKLLKKERFIRQLKSQIQQHRLTLNEKEQLIRQNEEVLQQLSQLHAEQEEQAELQMNSRLEEIERIRLENNQLQKEVNQLQHEMNSYVSQLSDKESEMDSLERLSEQNQLLLTNSRQLIQQLVVADSLLQPICKGEVKHLEMIDWEKVYKRIDKLFNRYTTRLRKYFPALTEEDIQCCCFIKLQMPNAAIARLYNIAPSSVTKRKQRIKERINMSKEGCIGKEQPVDVYLCGF